MEETFVRTEASSIPQGLHGLFNKLERHRPDGRQPDDFIEEVFHTLRDELGLSGVSVYGERRDGFEPRRYPAHLIAEIEVDGSFDEAPNRAFGPRAGDSSMAPTARAARSR